MTTDNLATIDERINPYVLLGEGYDPFGIAVRAGLMFPLAEAFKKFACAGIDGRAKSQDQDIKEAKYSVKRALKYIEQGYLGKLNYTFVSIDLNDVRGKYAEVFGQGYIRRHSFQCALGILMYANSGNVEYLKKIVET